MLFIVYVWFSRYAAEPCLKGSATTFASMAISDNATTSADSSSQYAVPRLRESSGDVKSDC